MTPDVYARYQSMAVPRYTSYPTVPYFTPAVQAGNVADWFAALDPKRPISLYLHVPFCRQVCWYCGCNMKLVNRYDSIKRYVDHLLAEIDLVAQHLPDRMRVSHLHWGGGTPTALEPADLAQVMDHVRQRFDILPDAELAIESDPRTLTQQMARMIGTLGFNRASFGVQEFSEKVQKAINRIQPPDMVRQSVDWLRGAGVSNINFDLIYGLPHQWVDDIRRTVDICVDMAPNRLALFGYAHVPWMAKKQRQIDEKALPDSAARFAQFSAASRALCDAGYQAIGLDHFAQPNDDLAVAEREGRLRRNFQGYTTDVTDTLIGLGATSIGRTPQGYYQNIPETGAWGRAVSDRSLPVAKGIGFGGQDGLRSAVIEQVMCSDHVDLGALGKAHGAASAWYAHDMDRLQPLVDDGLITLKSDVLTLKPQARLLRRVVAAAFDSYFKQARARHSVAV